MIKKFIFVLFSLLLLQYFPIYGQQKSIIKLNRHFLPIPENDSLNHRYNQIETLSATGETLIQTFDLQKRMVRQSSVGTHPTEGFKQEIIETFDANDLLISQKIINRDNSTYVISYYRDGVKKAQIIHHGKDDYEIWRNNSDSHYTSDHNDFEPGIKKKVWNSFLIKNLRYPAEARAIKAEGTVIVAILVDKDGNFKETEIANSPFVNSHLAEEALRVVRLFKGKFSPAKNLSGEEEEAWFILPLRFKLG